MVQLSPALPAGFQVFPPDNIWNTPIDTAPLHPLNAQWMDTINGHTAHPFHPNFGYMYLGLPNGFPYSLANNLTPLVKVAFRTDVSYPTESDPIPAAGLPIPVDTYTDITEGHVHVIDTDNKILHEFYGALLQADGSWLITQYSRWDLTSNALRPDGWTSTNAAGLPMFAGLTRWDEIANGVIPHALGFGVSLVYKPHMWPARHDAVTGSALNPVLGMRVRLKASFDISTFSPTNQIILTALKKYGMFLHDTSGDWYLSGAPNANFNDSDLHLLSTITPSTAFEVVDTSTWAVDPTTSGQVIPSVAVIPPVVPPVVPPIVPPVVPPAASPLLADYITYRNNLKIFHEMQQAIADGCKTSSDADYVILQALVKANFNPAFLELFKK